MRKKIKISTILVSFLLILSMSTAVTSFNIEEKNLTGEEDNPTTPINITKPKIGCLHVFGTTIEISFLEIMGWSVVINSELNVKTRGGQEADYVVFSVKKEGSASVKNYTMIDNEYPFNCSFKNIPTSFDYSITAKAYINESYINESVGKDTVDHVAYIKNPDVIR